MRHIQKINSERRLLRFNGETPQSPEKKDPAPLKKLTPEEIEAIVLPFLNRIDESEDADYVRRVLYTWLEKHDKNFDPKAKPIIRDMLARAERVLLDTRPDTRKKIEDWKMTPAELQFTVLQICYDEIARPLLAGPGKEEILRLTKRLSDMAEPKQAIEKTKKELAAFDAEWLERKPRDKKELFIAFHARGKQLYMLLSNQGTKEGEQLCKEKIRALEEEIHAEIRQNKEAFLQYLRTAAPYKQEKQEGRGKQVLDLLNMQDTIVDVEKKLKESTWLKGLLKDIQESVDVAVSILNASGKKVPYEIQNEKDSCICVRKTEKGDERWHVEPSRQERVIVRCAEGQNKGAFLSVEKRVLMEAIADGTLPAIFEQAAKRGVDAKKLTDALKKQITVEDEKALYTAKDGSRWELTAQGVLTGLYFQLQNLAQSQMRVKIWYSDLVGADMETLVRQAKDIYEKESTGRKLLEKFDLPKDAKIAHIKVFPKVEAGNDTNPVGHMLAHAQFYSGALKERYGDAMTIHPGIFSDKPTAQLTEQVKNAYADGCRTFNIDFFAHGDNRGLDFRDGINAKALMDLVRDYVKKDPACLFNIGTIACFGGALRNGFLEELRKDPALAKHVNVFLQQKPYDFNTSPHHVDKDLEQKMGKFWSQGTGTRYLSEFMMQILRKETYGKAASEADKKVYQESDSFLDPEAIIDGELITMATPIATGVHSG